MNEHVTEISAQVSIPAIEAQFWAMHKASREQAPLTERERRAQLKALRKMLTDFGHEFVDAISRDFGIRSANETRMAEILPSLTLVRDALTNLRRWMRHTRKLPSVLFLPARNRIYYQPKGVVLIIVPWNYPLLLGIGPLVAAIAAGNRVILKPSEFAPRTAEVLKHRLETMLGSDKVTVATGESEMAEALVRMPFDHILFTGSTGVGRKVMLAAARNLTPVTLELGGKSPAILHEDFDLALAAQRIVRGKLLNAGQTCIAPDYVLVPRTGLDRFIAEAEKAVAEFYPRLIDNRDYTAIINRAHYDRLTALIADARARGARVIAVDPAGELREGETGAADVHKMAPVLITGGTGEMDVLREEIFGPILPVVPYDTLDDAVSYVNARPRPLALYYFDTSSARIEHVLTRTVSGGVTVNDTIFHIAQDSLPFGGIGPSGMGAYHGHEGFRTFSHAKGAFLQSRIAPTGLLDPPYTGRFARVLAFASWWAA